MFLLKPLITVLIAAFLLTSCSTSTRPMLPPPKPLPAALMQPCPVPVLPVSNHQDDTTLALHQLYHQYGYCAALHWTTVLEVQAKDEP